MSVVPVLFKSRCPRCGEDALPPGLRVTFSALQKADRVLITFGASTKGIEAHMEAECRTAENAGVLLSQMQNVTASLKEAMSRDKQIRGDELARTLAAGTFAGNGTKVDGTWPVDKGLIDALTAGI